MSGSHDPAPPRRILRQSPPQIPEELLVEPLLVRAADPDLQRLTPILARLVEWLNPEAIWLFGSRAEGRARPDSDYDLLVVVPDGAPAAELDAVGAYELTRGMGLPIDVVPCPRSVFEEEKHESNTLARAAFARGKLLYEQAA